MTLLNLYALGRIGFGVAALLAPTVTGRLLAGEGGTAPDARAFLRGMGGREIGLGIGLLTTARAGGSTRPWLIASVLADSGDIAGIAGAWRQMAPDKRWTGIALAAATAATGLGFLAADRAR